MNLSKLATLPARPPEPPGQLIGSSPLMRAVYRQIDQVACSNATVLLLGETGTGKELAARTIHRLSERATGPMVVVNCGALPDQLLESELFGVEAGAYTGANHRRRGKAEMASGGTLFLDEIGELSLAGQVKLLRLLQDRTVERLGSESTIRVDVRVIAATHIDLALAVSEKRFRQDLYYRLNVFPICLPPLAARPDDIGPLAQCFLEEFALQHRRDVRAVSPDAMTLLHRHLWPGNVRELQNVVERAVLVADQPVIQAHHLLLPNVRPAAAPVLRTAADTLERQMIEEALRNSAGSQVRSAELLGTSERVLRYKLRKFGIDRRMFKRAAG